MYLQNSKLQIVLQIRLPAYVYILALKHLSPYKHYKKNLLRHMIEYSDYIAQQGSATIVFLMPRCNLYNVYDQI